MPKLTPEFSYMKGISIGERIKRILILAAIGFAIQLFVSPIIGWFAILFAALMGSMKSRSNTPEITTPGDWQPVTIEEMEKARKLLDSTSEVKSGSCGASGFGCLAVFGAIFIGAILFGTVDGEAILKPWAPVFAGGPLSVPFIADAVIFALVLMAGGRASAWEPPDLRTKFDQLSRILATAGSNPQLEFQPNMQLAKTTDGAVPLDLKLLVKMKDSPPNFIGIQVQVSFNQVQSRSLPYTYCVILAKPEFRLTKRTEMIEVPPEGGFPAGLLGLFADANEKRESKFARFHGSLIELKQEGEVDIAVVRQDTSKGTAGYTTTPSQALEVFSDAYVLAQQMLQDGAKEPQNQ